MIHPSHQGQALRVPVATGSLDTGMCLKSMGMNRRAPKRNNVTSSTDQSFTDDAAHGYTARAL
jgi:hypothetical protein